MIHKQGYANRPLSVICTARTGSSLLMKILEKHGYWTGGDKTIRPKHPVGCFENLGIQFGILRRSIKAPGSLNAKILRKQVMDRISSQGYQGRHRWAFKLFVAFFDIWTECFPESTYIFLRRDIEAVKRYRSRVGFAHRGEALERYKKVEECVKDTAFFVDYENIISGGYSQLEPVFKKEGIKFNREIIDDCVEPGLKHF